MHWIRWGAGLVSSMTVLYLPAPTKSFGFMQQAGKLKGENEANGAIFLPDPNRKVNLCLGPVLVPIS
jgi:hypothetical protein